ncbi:hypothetical protein EDD21DRAFT_352899 [Dissophora ornata]|nr:hypothetical protein EDD21DRAFT_352899 [Dissophora ornata]
MAELAQVVVANANPPKAQNKIRKKPSTLSLTTTTFIQSGSQNPSIIAHTPGGRGLALVGEGDYRYQYEAAAKEIKNWEKRYSSAQHQIHYERERWEEKYGLLEKAFKDLENNRAEANVEKMNSLLDTVQQLQIANETFRKQLMDAGIEPDPEPATQFHSHQLLVGENLDRTFLEQNEVMKEQSLITNQKISHLSSELNNVAIAISQTINYVQLRYLTQMLDAAEHVTSQKRSRVMSNSFLSDMLSRGVKKAGPLQPKNTITSATQTPPTLLSVLQLQQQQKFEQEFMQQHLALKPLDTKLSKSSFSFSNSLLSLAGLSHSDNGDGSKGMQYRLKGQLMDDRSQFGRSGIAPGLMHELKGSPTSPDSADIRAASRCSTPATKFQYASPTTSQLRIIVPDVKTPCMASGPLASAHYSAEGSLRWSSSDASLAQSAQQQLLSVRGADLHRPTSQQFLSPDMAILYNNNNSNNGSSMVHTPPVSVTTNNRFLSASNIPHEGAW